MSWKIGEVIQKTGLTARALHFYEEQGLIGPISRTEAGHRLYKQADLIRLQQIRSMRLLGVQIADMPSLLHDDTSKMIDQLKQQLQRLSLQRAVIQTFEDRTSKLLESLKAETASPESLDNFLFQTLESMIMYDKYFTQNDIDEIHNHGHSESDSLSVEDAWNQWIESMKTLIRSGATPQSDKVKKLMVHWDEMLDHMSDGDQARRQAFNDLLHNEKTARRDHGLDDDLFEFMGKAMGNH